MLKLALVLAAVAAFAPAAATADQTDPAPATGGAPAATPAVVVDMANDPRMLAALRHANAKADAKCGVGAGLGVTDLQSKMVARTCRRHIVEAARLDAEFEIKGR
jgi:hypothetical protein